MALITSSKPTINSFVVILLLLPCWIPLIANVASHQQVTTPSSSSKVYQLGQKEDVMMGETFPAPLILESEESWTFPGRKVLYFRKDYEDPDSNVNPGSTSIPPPPP